MILWRTYTSRRLRWRKAWLHPYSWLKSAPLLLLLQSRKEPCTHSNRHFNQRQRKGICHLWWVTTTPLQICKKQQFLCSPASGKAPVFLTSELKYFFFTYHIQSQQGSTKPQRRDLNLNRISQLAQPLTYKPFTPQHFKDLDKRAQDLEIERHKKEEEKDHHNGKSEKDKEREREREL